MEIDKRIIVKESFKLPGMDVVIEAGQEIHITGFKESSLSRVFKKMEEHECGTITAYRGEFTYKENRARLESLNVKLTKLGYRLTELNGVYIENFGSTNPEKPEKTVKERIFFAEDFKDYGTIKKDLMDLGEEFDQESILFIPKGGLSATLIGTSHDQDAYLDYHEEIPFSNRSFGEVGEFMTKVKNRPFMFESFEREQKRPSGFYGNWGLDAASKKHWREFLK